MKDLAEMGVIKRHARACLPDGYTRQAPIKIAPDIRQNQSFLKLFEPPIGFHKAVRTIRCFGFIAAEM